MLADPCLEDLCKRYGFTPETARSEVQRRLKEDEERVRREIQKELKIKEGAENLRRAATVKKTTGKSDVSAEIKRSNARLEELNQELEEIRTFQLVTSDGSTTFTAPGCCTTTCLLFTRLVKFGKKFSRVKSHSLTH